MTGPAARINRIFAAAEKDGRSFLLEPEVYALLRAAGLPTARHAFVPAGAAIDGKSLSALGSARVAVKVVSPLIVHKSDVGGVRMVEAKPKAVKKAMDEMLEAIPADYVRWAQGLAKSGKKTVIPDKAEVRDSIKGFLVVEKVAYEDVGFGSELLFGVRNTRDFGPVLTVGSGGLDVEYMSQRLREGQATASASVHLLRDEDALGFVEPLAFFGKLAAEFRGRKPLVKPEAIIRTLVLFRDLARTLSPFSAGSPYVIEEAEVNPFVAAGGRLIPLDGVCRFSRDKKEPAARDLQAVDKLLKPRSIGIIGVSEKMNIGRIILRNIIKSGFPAEGIFVIKPGLSEIDGCRCVPTIADLPQAVDLFILTLGADKCSDVMRDLVENEKARSVIIIAGGMGEKAGGASIEDNIREILAEGRKAGRLTPVVNGGNCLGIISRPGSYDTLFIPENKLPKSKGGDSGLAFISQSGAFMISRLSKMPEVNPIYSVSLGNQIDLTVSDYARYLENEDDVKVAAMYIEGFKPLDGCSFAAAVGDMTRKKGQAVVVYKAGRSPEGRAATSSHTASVAGDYGIFKEVLKRSGAIIADDLFQFESFTKGLAALRGRRVRGRRVGIISNAGFECVVLADNLKDGAGLDLAGIRPGTGKKILEALQPLGIDRLLDIHNPLDVTPVADDRTFCECARALVESPEVDCAVISNVPFSAALSTLPGDEDPNEYFSRPGCFAQRTVELFNSTDKPIVVNIDAGDLYTPLANYLEGRGMPVFRRADQAISFLREYVGHRLGQKDVKAPRTKKTK